MDKSELKAYRLLLLEVAQLREQLTALESSLYSPKGQRFTSTPASSGKGITMDGVIDRHMKLEAKYREALAEKEGQQLAVEKAIEALENPPERLVMRYRYIEGRSWAYICGKLHDLGFSERQVYRLHGYALQKING